jgi:LPXTG-site transpeptidase (sortase) family protein
MKLPKPYNTTVFLLIASLVAGIWVYLGTGQVLSISRWIRTNRQATITPAPSVSPTSKATLGPPTAINIPKIHKNLPIKPATVRGNDWEMFGDAVAWLSTSAVPGEGNVVLYAHNWRSLWADLYLLKPGDTIDVEQNNLWKTYTVTESRDVDQHDIQSVLSNENRLTLYTCEGSFDQKRRVVYADPIE